MACFTTARDAAATHTGRPRISHLFNALLDLLDDHEVELREETAALAARGDADPILKADIQLAQAILCFNAENDEQARRHFEACRDLLRQADEEEQAQQVYNEVVNMYLEAQESLSALPYAQECCRLYEEQNDEKRLARMLNNLGLAYLSQHRLAEALPIFRRGLAINRKINNVDVVQSYNNLASLYYRMQLLETALATYKLALDSSREFGLQHMVPIILGNIANINTDMGNYTEALSYYRQALPSVVADPKHKAVILNNIGMVLYYRQNYNEAIEHYEQSLRVCRENRLAYTEAKNLCNLGQLYQERRQDDKALAVLREAIAKTEKTGDMTLLVDAKVSLGLLYVAQQELPQAEELLQEAFRLQKEQGGDLCPVMKAFVQLYAAKGEVERLAAQQADLIALYEKDHEERYTQLVAEMQATLNLELKEQEAEMQRQKAEELQKMNEEILRQKQQLQLTLDELRKSEISCEFLHREFKDQLGSIIIGQSEQMKKLLSLIRLVAAASDTSVLITGETGTGKELVARAIHDVSNRSRRNFCAVNASSVPESLFESEFFGYRKNAFTGADRDKTGWFEIANEGTLFLDEVGTWRADIQTKFLRVLESRKIIPVGADREIPVDFRLISATNDDLQSMMQDGSFRADLYYRLSSFIIHIPPLRERADDIPLLLEYFVQYFNQRLNKKITRIESQVEKALCAYQFPGNVRELRNMVEHAMIISNTSTLRLSSFAIPMRDEQDSVIVPLAQQEQDMILRALKHTNYHQSNAAALLGLTPKSLERRMKKFDIVNPKREK